MFNVNPGNQLTLTLDLAYHDGSCNILYKLCKRNIDSIGHIHVNVCFSCRK